jgi:hypothetical protein
MIRAHARAAWSWARFDTPRQASVRSAVLAAVLAVSMTGIARSYRAETAGDIIPPELYAEFSGAGADWLVTAWLVASDGVGRAWLAGASWVPEPAAWLVLGAVLLVYYAATLEFGARAAREMQELADGETEVSG